MRLSLFFLIAIHFSFNAQNNYYLFNKYLIKAEIAAKYRKYTTASENFLNARKIAPENYIFSLKLAHYYSIFPEYQDSAIAYFKKAIFLGYSPEFIINETKGKKITRTDKWKSFMTETKDCVQKANKLIRDEEQVHFIQNIFHNDQRVRDDSHPSAMKDMVKVDSINLISLMDFVKGKQFPIYPFISVDENIETIIMHLIMYDWPATESLMDTVTNLCKTNKLEYRSYMLIIDRRYKWKYNKNQKFGWFYSSKTRTIEPVDDCKKVDEIRYQYNMPTLYEDCLLYDLKPPAGYHITEKMKAEYSEIIK